MELRGRTGLGDHHEGPHLRLRLQGPPAPRFGAGTAVRDQERQDRSHRRPQGQRPASDRRRMTTGPTPVASSSAGTVPDAGELPRLLTIGHSNRSLNEFTELLTNTGTEVVVDVRRLPGSNRYPQFNADTL